jgi:hypothetical protein
MGGLRGWPQGILHVFNTILYENEFQNPQIFQQTIMHQSFSRAIYFSLETNEKKCGKVRKLKKC